MSCLLILYSYYCRFTAYMATSLLVQGILDANKLIRLNYVDGLRNLKIILIQEKVSYILDSPASDTIGEDVSEEKKATYKM